MFILIEIYIWTNLAEAFIQSDLWASLGKINIGAARHIIIFNLYNQVHRGVSATKKGILKCPECGRIRIYTYLYG